MSKGYGVVHYRLDGRRTWLVHRLVWRLLVGGTMPDELHHACRQTACCNPAHLRPVTRQEHGEAHRDDQCRAGHDLTDPANVYLRRVGDRSNVPVCRRCRTEREAARRARLTEDERRAEIAKRTERRRRQRSSATTSG